MGRALRGRRQRRLCLLCATLGIGEGLLGGALFLGCGCTTFVFCTLIIGLMPWYDPRYLMPDSVRDAIIESSCYTNASQ